MTKTTGNPPKSSHLAAAAAALAGIAATSVMPASASAIQEAYYAHTRLCVRLLLNDKPAHNAQCLPNTSPNPPAHAGSGGPALVAPPPLPPVPEPEDDDSYPQQT